MVKEVLACRKLTQGLSWIMAQSDIERQCRILRVCDEGRIGGIRLYDAGRQVYLHDITETAVLR
ncbi:hypothetical protein SAMN02910292_02973 [Lachnospiraceae bacterium XBB2008]|nr:hypothetical protein SAMN02910292_02973 [Lachnospiraceae bacterium XBB2008]